MVKIKNNRKAQHEIVGFILIVVIVVIIGLFLLIFYLRQKPVRHESLDIQNFLHSSMLYTTDCFISAEPPLDLEDLIKSCYRSRECLNEKMACFVLDESLSELVHESWLVAAEKPVNSYSLVIYYEEDNTKEELLEIEEGNCTGSKTGAEHLIHQYPGNIIISMEICYI